LIAAVPDDDRIANFGLPGTTPFLHVDYTKACNSGNHRVIQEADRHTTVGDDRLCRGMAESNRCGGKMRLNCNSFNKMGTVVGLMAACAVTAGMANAAEPAPAPAPVVVQPPAAPKPAAVLTAEQAAELARLQQCDRTLCGMALKPTESGTGALKCDLARTWTKDEIVTAWSKSTVSWPFGEARCTVKLDVDSKLLTSAITTPKYKLKVPAHSISCEVENGGPRYPLTVSAAPEVEFKDGKATVVLLGVNKIEGNSVIKSVVWTVTKMESTFGIFQKDLVKGVNDYITDYCNKTYGKGN
jgi:hypothetical protein